MGAQGFSRAAIELVKNNRNLRTSSRKEKLVAGKNIDGKKPVKFAKASLSVKARIKADKTFVQEQIRFRIGILITIVVFALLFLFLFLSFG